MIRSKCVTLAILPFLLLVAGGMAQSQSSESVKSARPVEDLLDKLRSKYGWAVNFEEPRYLFAGDREDVSEEVRARRALPQAVHGYYAHRATELNVTLPEVRDGVVPPEHETLQRIVDAYNLAQGNEYEVRTDGGRYSIVGIAAKDQNGQFQQQLPILDMKVTLDPAERDGNVVLLDLCRKISERTGVRVSYGPGPSNAMAQLKFTNGFSGSARDIISQVLSQSAIAHQSAWVLLYGPSEDRYGLSIVYSPRADLLDSNTKLDSVKLPQPQSGSKRGITKTATKP